MENDQIDYLIEIAEPVSDNGENTTIIEICRLCGKKTTNYIPIFEENNLILEKMNKCLPINITNEDELPSNICKRCFHYLNISYKLIISSVKTDALLREKLKERKKEIKTIIDTEVTEINSPTLCEMCNTLFLDIKSFNKHIETMHSTVNKYCCNSCKSSFTEYNDLLNHKCETNANINISNNYALKEIKQDSDKFVISQIIQSTPINLVPIVQKPVEKPKILSKSVPNIIRSRNTPPKPKFIIPTNTNPIKIIPATPLNFPNNASFLSVTPGTNAVEPRMKLVPISPALLSKSISTPASSFKLLPANISNSASTLKILPTTTVATSATSTIQILPTNVLPNASTNSTLKIIRNPLMTFTSNSMQSIPNCTTSTAASTLEILPTEFPSSSSTLRIIPTNVSTTNHIAIPVNAKVAIPRITSKIVKEIKPKIRRGPRTKKPTFETALPALKTESIDHTYTNNDNDNNDSDDSCNLPLQDAPTVHISTCAYDVQCDICGIGVDDDELLIAHKKIHLPQKMGCKECHQECDSLYDLYMHKKKKHNVYKRVSLKFSCEQCGKFFTNSWQWENHEEHKCKKKFPMYPCKYCEMGFSTNHKLKRHLRKHKKEMLEDPDVQVFKCVACPKVFVDEEFYQKHRNVHDPECWDKYKCNVCNRSFRDNVRLKEHQQSIHEGIKPHQCDVCGRTFHRRSNMKVHREKHFARKCEHCDETFLKLSALITHIKDIHKLEPSRKLLAKKQYKSGCYVCRFCGKKLSTHQSVLDHERIHTGEKPHECKTCGKSFRTYTARWAHVQRHQKGSYTCEHCGKIFSYKQNLLTHILIHMPVEERKHQCTKCGKKFLRKGHLNIHMRIHNGERPYTCDICNYSFTQMGDMRRHRARHSSNYVKTRKSRMKLINTTPEKDNEAVIDIQKTQEYEELEDGHNLQQYKNMKVDDIEEIVNIKVIQQLHSVDDKSITIIQSADDLQESENMQEVEIEQINNDLEYQINFIMNQEEPAEEIVIHEQDC